jgi:hypothetical protein
MRLVPFAEVEVRVLLVPVVSEFCDVASGLRAMAERGTICVEAAATPVGRRPVAPTVEVMPAKAIAAVVSRFHFGSV